MYPDAGTFAGIIMSVGLHVHAMTLFYSNMWAAYWFGKGALLSTSKVLLFVTIIVLLGNFTHLYPFSVGAIIATVTLTGHLSLLIATSIIYFEEQRKRRKPKRKSVSKSAKSGDAESR